MTLLEHEPLLEVLAARLGETAGGAGQIALVHGEAGIGKTALVDCFTRERPRRGRVLRGACDSLLTPAAAGAPPATSDSTLLDVTRATA